MSKLATKYLGLNLKGPIGNSASPLTKNLDNIKKMEDSGSAFVVLHSLFEEQIIQASKQLDHYLEYGSESFAEALTYVPKLKNYNVGPQEYLDLIRKAKDSVKIPIIASLNCANSTGWTDFSKEIEKAGADAIELNIYSLPTDPNMDACELQENYIHIVTKVRESVKIPITVKISHFFSSIPNMAQKIKQGGANGLVLFNRFYQPDFDINNLEVKPSLQLSTSYSLRLPMHWMAILYGKIDIDLGLSSGVHNSEDVVKGLMAGANVVMMTSEILKNGIDRMKTIYQDLQNWMENKEYESVDQLRGVLSQNKSAEPHNFERVHYMETITSYSSDTTGKMI